MNGNSVSVRVRSEYACFTRPENKVERVSYPIMTPSAARGVLDAIYWHPQFAWRIRSISVLAPVRTYGVLRNEVNSKMALDRKEPYFADEDRSQRYAVCLRDVDYVIAAEPVPSQAEAEPMAKHRDIFLRRVAKGQCYHRPALGTREFAAEFEPADGSPPPIDWTEDLGLMLWDMDYSSGKLPYWPLFFQASVENGVMQVPDRPLGGRG
ncbi:MAG: type I-C CRISPR-associated protein Cas5 [Chthonomonadales bacterium]|nr:type I-C CRISPR-associated protein Cas5 [Chthonomonadales bacterium]